MQRCPGDDAQKGIVENTPHLPSGHSRHTDPNPPHAVAYLKLSDNFSQTKHAQYREDRNESGTAVDGIHYLLCKAGHHFPGRQNLSYHVVRMCVCARYTVGGGILQTKANDKKKQLKSLHLYATSKYANYKLEVYQNTSNVSAGHYFKLTSSFSLNYHHLQKTA